MKKVYQIELFVEDMEKAVEIFSKQLAFSIVRKIMSDGAPQQLDSESVTMKRHILSDPGVSEFVELIIKDIRGYTP